MPTAACSALFPADCALVAGRRHARGGVGDLGGGNWTIFAVDHVHDYSSDDAGFGLRVHVHGEGEAVHIGVVLHETDVFDEEGGRFDHAAFRPHQSAGVGVHKNASLEQTGAVLARLHVEHVHQAVVQR